MPRVFTESERQEFLAGKHVGVLSVVAPDGRPPASVPIWYDYTAGGNIRISTGASSRKAKLIEQAQAVTLVAQNEGHVVNTTSGNGGFTPLINSAVYATTKAAVVTITECLWGQLREVGSDVSASLLYPSTRTPGMLDTGIWRPGANRPDRYDRPGAPPQEGRDAKGEYLTRMDSAGLEVVFAPLSEVADLCFDGIRDDVFWITVPNDDQQQKIRARADSQIAQSSPDYLLGGHMMAVKPDERS